MYFLVLWYVPVRYKPTYDGRVVIIYNHSWGLKSLGRGKLNVAISHDDGLTWTPSSTVVLESFHDGAISDVNVDKKKSKETDRNELSGCYSGSQNRFDSHRLYLR